MTLRTSALLLTACVSLALTGCGVFFAPISYAKAASANANYTFKGTVVDPANKPVQGVVAAKSSERRFWAAIEGTTNTYKEDYTRVDGDFIITVRGSNLTVTFSKNGYRDASFRFSADAGDEVTTDLGAWHNSSNFTVLMIPVNARDAYLAHHKAAISYEHYPIADAISLPNLLTEGVSGDIIYKNKDAMDPTVIPDGTFYAIVDSAPPQAINQFGKIDPAEMHIPNSLALRIAGPDTGFIRMTPRTGLHPMFISTLAPDSGYQPELKLSRERLKEMRQAPRQDIAQAHEYFYFRAGNRFGKGTLSWTSTAGKPQFTFDLYLQRRANTRDLTTFEYKL